LRDESFVVLRASRDADPDGSRLRGALAAHAGLDRARRRRDWLVVCLALLGAPLWLAAARRSPGELRTLALAGWSTCAVAVLVAVVSERRWRRALALSAARLAPSPGLAAGAPPEQSPPPCGGDSPRP
jgi:hypothetical protein